MGFLRSWNNDTINDFVVNRNYCLEDDARIDVKKRQAMSLYDMTDTWKLRQKEFLKEYDWVEVTSESHIEDRGSSCPGM